MTNKTQKLIHGDCLQVIKSLLPNSVDSIVTDPPYELGFMGKSWDNTGIANNVELWKECLRVLKPGGHLLAFSGTRTYHRMAVAIEDAGFEVRDMIEWVYGSGFPKSLNIGKVVDKLQGNEREIEEREPFGREGRKTSGKGKFGVNGWDTKPTMQYTKGTSEWEGWGTALKPAHEPICLARKPLAEKTVAENCLKYGTGGINIDESRVETDGTPRKGGATTNGNLGWKPSKEIYTAGRFPSNLIHDNSEEVRECFPETKSTVGKKNIQHNSGNGEVYGGGKGMAGVWSEENTYNDSGNASRFFKSIIYQAKASKSERNKGCEGMPEKRPDERTETGMGTFEEKGVAKQSNFHPTVKPIALMEYLIKMVTPKGGIVLEPFAGSGSTLVAAKENGFGFIGIELTAEYIPIIEARTGVKAEKIIEEIKSEEKVNQIKTLPNIKLTNICDCGGKIVNYSGGKCCQDCMKDY